MTAGRAVIVYGAVKSEVGAVAEVVMLPIAIDMVPIADDWAKVEEMNKEQRRSFIVAAEVFCQALADIVVFLVKESRDFSIG